MEAPVVSRFGSRGPEDDVAFGQNSATQGCRKATLNRKTYPGMVSGANLELVRGMKSFGFERAVLSALLLAVAMTTTPFEVRAGFVQIEPADTTNGYLARLLINEAPFPGERGYMSESDTRGAMLQILWVLHGRIHLIPARYRQRQVAGVSSTDIIDIITGTGGRQQCEGFSRDANGNFVAAPRVEERLKNLVNIADSGGKPGRFAGLLNYAQGLANAYFEGGIEEADRYAQLHLVGAIPVTGRAYSWMTDLDKYHPGGNFVSIPTADQGVLGGNRFFTLRKSPK